MYYCDYHIHSKNLFDGKDSVMEHCQRAQEIAITDHFEPTKSEQEFKQYQPLQCLEYISKARLRYENNLKVKFGIE